MNFKQYIAEKKASSLTPEEQQQSRDFIDNLKNKYNTRSKQLALKRQIEAAPTKRVRVGDMRVFNRLTDKFTDVRVYIEFKKKDWAGYYMRRGEETHRPEIVLSYEILFSDKYYKDVAYGLMQHELLHAVQHYKTPTEEYKAYVASNDRNKNPADYYYSPHEREVQIMELMYYIQNHIKNIREKGKGNYNYIMPAYKRILMKFIRTKWEDFDFNSLPLPFHMKSEFLHTISKSSGHVKSEKDFLREFKLKLYNFLKKVPSKI